MISRRNIRIKVLQAIYSTMLQNDPDTENSPSITVAQEHYTFLLKNFIHTVYFFTSFWVRFFAYQDDKEKSLQMQCSLFQSSFFQNFLKATLAQEAQKFCADKLEQEWMNNLFKKVSLVLETLPPYQHFIEKESNFSELEIIQELWTHLENETDIWTNYIEEYIPHADADDGLLRSLIPSIFSSNDHRRVEEMIIPKDKQDFGANILETTLEKNQYIQTILSNHIKNWDMSRVNKIDLIALQMATSELLFFKEIEHKIVINEYVDIVKIYSGKKSGKFVNGVIDSIYQEVSKPSL